MSTAVPTSWNFEDRQVCCEHRVTCSTRVHVRINALSAPLVDHAIPALLCSLGLICHYLCKWWFACHAHSCWADERRVTHTSMSELAFSRLLARFAVSSLAACSASLCTSSSARSLAASLLCSGEAAAAGLLAALLDASCSWSCLQTKENLQRRES